jgi:DNA-directed RNA polymerase subunit delta
LTKKRVVKDYEALPEEIVREVKLRYPTGFANFLVSYTDKEGKKVSALPFETEEMYYLIRMTIQEAKRIVKEDEDYDDEGILRGDFGDGDTPDDLEAAGEEEEDDDLDSDDEASDHIIVTRRNSDPEDIADDTDY